MRSSRWLLPFTGEVDMQAIDAVVRLAEYDGATLVAVSLISPPDTIGKKRVRLEQIQRSKDFLEAVKWKATRFGIPLEEHELYTADVVECIALQAQSLCCEALLLVSRGERVTLLRAPHLKRLCERPPVRLLVLRLIEPEKQKWRAHPWNSLLARLRRPLGLQQSAAQEENLAAPQVPTWKLAEEQREKCI